MAKRFKINVTQPNSHWERFGIKPKQKLWQQWMLKLTIPFRKLWRRKK